METTPGATPAQAATPPNGEHDKGTPTAPMQAPVTPAPQGSNVGMVTISTEEYARLQRSDARMRSPKRTFPKPAQQQILDPNDPTDAELAQTKAQLAEANDRALRLEVGGKVRDLLAEDRFKNIPQSTKDLILQNPQVLSQAESLDEALYDIEDRLVEIADKSGVQTQQQNQSTTTPQTQVLGQRDTPPVTTPGAAAPIDAGALEDVSKLRGSERSTAILRNSFRKQKIGQ